MAATVRCNYCGRLASARIIENDSFVVSDDIDWHDRDYESDWVVVNGKLYVYYAEDVECRLFRTWAVTTASTR